MDLIDMKTVKIRRYFLMVVVIFISTGVIVISTGLGQFSQAIASHDDIRDYKLKLWANENPRQNIIVENFTNECLNRSSVKKNTELDRVAPIYLRTCAEKIGATDILPIIASVNAILPTHPWPLSVIATF